jgi:ATP-dependent Clp protease ATP-binding subunit ClpA
VKCLLIITVDFPVSTEAGTSESLREALLQTLPRELVERVDRIISFQELEPAIVREILRRALEKFYEELRPHGIRMRVLDAGYRLLINQGYSPAEGVTNLPAVLERDVFQPIRALMAAHRISHGSDVEIAVEQDHVTVKIPEASHQ